MTTTYGVGAMVAAGEQSFIVGGIDRWAVHGEPDLREFRLETWLGISGFRLPPASDPPAGDGVRVRRFPERYSCDDCSNNLRWYREFNSPTTKNECSSCGSGLTPSRFVVACDAGHIDDFPYWEWVHRGQGRDGGGGDHRLALTTTGRTSALRSVLVSCTCGVEVSLEGAFGRAAMPAIRYTCSGARPWLGRDAREQGCDATPRTLQRGSSSAWFPVTRSALSIPPFSEKLFEDIRPYLTLWRGESDDTIRRQAGKDPRLSDYDPDKVVAAVREYESYEAGERPDPSVVTGFEAGDTLRAEEYEQLHHEASTEDFMTRRSAPPQTAAPVRGLDHAMLVERLREVRALQSFTRVDPPTEGDRKGRLADLSVNAVPWLPGAEVKGEGVFLSFSADALMNWEQRATSPPTARSDRIRRHHDELLRSRTADGDAPTSPVTARLILVHTFAHALINEWSLDAGYPAASLRERLYVSPDMAGVLIYTATSDSAGSLGGLVARGKPGLLRESVEAALRRQAWCSSDPLCVEAESSGADSLNLAACHACVLLPETSCENNNTFLDRAMLIGTPDDPRVGFFDGVVAD